MATERSKGLIAICAIEALRWSASEIFSVRNGLRTAGRIQNPDTVIKTSRPEMAISNFFAVFMSVNRYGKVQIMTLG